MVEEMDVSLVRVEKRIYIPLADDLIFSID
jgi:hypothetical protein